MKALIRLSRIRIQIRIENADTDPHRGKKLNPDSHKYRYRSTTLVPDFLASKKKPPSTAGTHQKANYKMVKDRTFTVPYAIQYAVPCTVQYHRTGTDTLGSLPRSFLEKFFFGFRVENG
jgi:hypothetical protein